MNPAAIPEAMDDWHGDGRWMSMHERFVYEGKEKEPEVLFIGDSILQMLQYTDIWDRMFVPLHCLNFSIGGDTTQNILWRLNNGELKNLSPKVIVIMAGTNNHHHTAEEVFGGIMEILQTIQKEQAQAQVIVMGLPPRGQRPNKLREKIADINKRLQEEIKDVPNVQYVNIDPTLFVGPDGTISHEDMYDYLHFTRQGYQRLVESLLDEIQILLKAFMKADTESLGDGDN